MKKEVKKKNTTNHKNGKSRVTIQKEKEREQKRKKRALKMRKFCFLMMVLVLLSIGIWILFQFPIKNIVVKGNTFLSDQEIIDLAGIRNYPSTLKSTTFSIQEKLEENDFILSAKVTKKNFLTKVVIEVTENKPLFYYETKQKVILSDGTEVEGNYPVPTVINQIPDEVYEKFLGKMNQVPEDVLKKISEIRYYPNDVDEELFLMTMNDGNYVYVTIPKFERLYNYLEYVEGFDNKKGILHLDSGDYLEILEEE